MAEEGSDAKNGKSPPTEEPKEKVDEREPKTESVPQAVSTLRKSIEKRPSVRKPSTENSEDEEGRHRLTAKGRTALGSIIDILQSDTPGDICDKRNKTDVTDENYLKVYIYATRYIIKSVTMSDNNSTTEVARYANSYKLQSDKPFHPEKVEKILCSIMSEVIDGLTYDPIYCAKKAKATSSLIRSKVKELEFDRYKLVCVVSIGEKNCQDVLSTCRFLWDADKDRYAIFAVENTFVYAIAQCFGLYYE